MNKLILIAAVTVAFALDEPGAGFASSGRGGGARGGGSIGGARVCPVQFDVNFEPHHTIQYHGRLTKG